MATKGMLLGQGLSKVRFQLAFILVPFVPLETFAVPESHMSFCVSVFKRVSCWEHMERANVWVKFEGHHKL